MINPGTDRGQQELVRVFFAASHVPVAMAIEFGLALGLAMFAARSQEMRWWAWQAGGIAAAASMLTAILTWRTTGITPERLGALIPFA